MDIPEKLRFVNLPRDPGHRYFDEARVRVVERLKDSEISGSEWRFSCVVELLRKGEVRASLQLGSDMTIAATMMQWGLQVGPGELDMDRWHVEDLCREDELCCQPGCAEYGDHVYVLKEVWNSTCTRSWRNSARAIAGAVLARRFCKAHSDRGDGGLDDAMANYYVFIQCNEVD